jgi:glycerol uptake facilitator-like aquaporin
MPYKKYVCELLGAFSLTFAVWLSSAYVMPFPTPLVAALTLGLFVYLVGPISGAHLNPAVTLGIASIRKISPQDALLYIVAQFIGAGAAIAVGFALSGDTVSVAHDTLVMTGIAEAIGAFFLCFAVAAATLGKLQPDVTGVVVGGSLLLGIYMAMPFSNAILNPAVALGIGSFGVMYIIGPIVGAVAGAWAAYWLLAGKPVKARK